MFAFPRLDALFTRGGQPTAAANALLDTGAQLGSLAAPAAFFGPRVPRIAREAIRTAKKMAPLLRLAAPKKKSLFKRAPRRRMPIRRRTRRFARSRRRSYGKRRRTYRRKSARRFRRRSRYRRRYRRSSDPIRALVNRRSRIVTMGNSWNDFGLAATAPGKFAVRYDITPASETSLPHIEMANLGNLYFGSYDREDNPQLPFLYDQYAAYFKKYRVLSATASITVTNRTNQFVFFAIHKERRDDDDPPSRDTKMEDVQRDRARYRWVVIPPVDQHRVPSRTLRVTMNPKSVVDTTQNAHTMAHRLTGTFDTTNPDSVTLVPDDPAYVRIMLRIYDGDEATLEAGDVQVRINYRARVYLSEGTLFTESVQ